MKKSRVPFAILILVFAFLSIHCAGEHGHCSRRTPGWSNSSAAKLGSNWFRPATRSKPTASSCRSRSRARRRLEKRSTATASSPARWTSKPSRWPLFARGPRSGRFRLGHRHCLRIPAGRSHPLQRPRRRRQTDARRPRVLLRLRRTRNLARRQTPGDKILRQPPRPIRRGDEANFSQRR